MDYKPINDSQDGSGYQQHQHNLPNYNYPSEQAINEGSFHNYVAQGEPIQGAYIINMQQQNVEMNVKSNNFSDPPYMEHPNMNNPFYDNHQFNDNQNIQQNLPVPLAPPPPPKLQNAMLSDSVSDPFDVRSLEEIQECRHTNSQKYLYVSSPKLVFSVIIIAFYIVGVISLIVGLVILAVVAILALTDGKGDCNCNLNCGTCNGCNCGNLDCCLDVSTCCLRCCEICTFNSYQYSYSNYGYDHRYYGYRYNRRKNYYDYQNSNSYFCESLSRCFYDCFCCSCLDSLSIGSAKNSCMINKVEVYCTACNTKLKEEWTGTKHIVPALILGILGIIILVVSVLLLKHYQV